MTNLLIGAVLGCGAFAIIEGVLLFGRAQNLLNYAEELLARAEPPLLPAEKIAAVITDLPTEPLPVQPQPTPGPRTVPTEQAITVVAITEADDWRARWDAEIAEMRAKWDSEDAA